MTAKDCPACGLVHPGSAKRCECGYDFTSGKRHAPSTRSRDREPWHEDPVAVVLLLLLCWPVGIALTWKNKRLTWNAKTWITIAWFLLFSIWVFSQIHALAMRPPSSQ